MVKARRPRASISLPTLSARSATRSTKATSQPARARQWAVLSPMPWPPPTIRAFLLLSPKNEVSLVIDVAPELQPNADRRPTSAPATFAPRRRNDPPAFRPITNCLPPDRHDRLTERNHLS